MCSPARCSRLMISRSRQTTWIELKKPFQMHTHTSANEPVSVPSWVTKRLLPTTKVTTPAMIAAIGSTFQSLWKINIRRNLPR